MSGFPRLIEGEVEEQESPRVRELEAQLRKVERERDDALRAAERAQEDANRALAALRRQLSPLYRALQAVFGELDAAGIADAAPASAAPATENVRSGGRDAREMAIWADWKEKLPPSCAKVIDALLLHSDLTVEQLKVACRLGRDSVYQATSRLGQAGLVVKNGGRFSLKQL